MGQSQSNSGNLMSQEYEAKIRGLVNFNSVNFKSNLVQIPREGSKNVIFRGLVCSHKIPIWVLITALFAGYGARVFPMFLPFFFTYSEFAFAVIK
jgi:hypothetical protein